MKSFCYVFRNNVYFEGVTLLLQVGLFFHHRIEYLSTRIKYEIEQCCRITMLNEKF